MKFRKGDIVKVMPYSWYEFFKDKNGNVWPNDIGVEDSLHYFSAEMASTCGDFLEITDVVDNGYKVRGMNEIFEDWMLEDDVVKTTEEKTEDCKVLKFIKSMETKEMTKNEVFEFLKNTKIMCTSDEETKKVQKKLFELGIEWKMQGVKINEKVYLLHINYNYLLFNSDIRNWMNSKDKRIEPSEILAIKLKEEKPRFDPYSLEDFAKVLVREEDTNKWRLSFFDTYEPGCFCCMDYCYKQCVPYNEETKYLKDTTDEAPEFYNIWE
jgi:hypothetical protein